MSKIREKGITLVALVVTIIIMLILAGVTIGIIVGDNGLFKKTQKAVDTYQVENEREVIGMSVTSYKLGEYTGNQDIKLGKSLADRNLENSSIWDIIVEKSENKEYGTGWNYIEKGTNIEGYGKAKNNWVINYETGEIIKLEDDTYNNFNYKSSIAVEGPIYNLDSANVGLDKASWGNNATLYYYDNEEYSTIEKRKNAYNEQKDKTVETFGGYDRQISENISDYLDESTGAFKFNGNNYIEINNPNGFDFAEGLTFEFYGNITGQVAATVTKEENSSWNSCCGLFGLWNGKHSNWCETRFLYLGNAITYTIIIPQLLEDGKIRDYGEWSNSSTAKWNQSRSIGNIFNKEIYFTITIENVGDDKITQSLYTYIGDESKEYKGWLYKDIYEKFVETAKELNYLELGRCSYGGKTDYPNWCYLKGLCYSTRIYNRALSKEEVQANYDKTTDFHKYIIDSKK